MRQAVQVSRWLQRPGPPAATYPPEVPRGDSLSPEGVEVTRAQGKPVAHRLPGERGKIVLPTPAHCRLGDVDGNGALPEVGNMMLVRAAPGRIALLLVTGGGPSTWHGVGRTARASLLARAAPAAYHVIPWVPVAQERFGNKCSPAACGQAGPVRGQGGARQKAHDEGGRR